MPIDYTKFKDNDQAEEASLDKRWWKAPEDSRHTSVSRIVSMLAQADSARQAQIYHSSMLYGQMNLVGISGATKTPGNLRGNGRRETLTYNVIQSAIDTVVSKLGQNRPKPLFLTSGGDYKIQRRAKKLDKFVEGVFYENDIPKLGRGVLRDGAIWGDGLLHVFAHNDRIRYERVLPGELLTDWFESYYGEPRQLHRIKSIDREVLAELFPDFRERIYESGSSNINQAGIPQNVADQITVIESWHLPSGPNATDGLHGIYIDNATLFQEEWKHDFFPFAKMSWNNPVVGWWGQSAVEQIQDIQVEMNSILWIISRSLKLAGSFKVLIENGSRIVREHLTNDVGALIYYTGTPPQYITPAIVPNELYTQLQTLKEAAYEKLGVSQMAATATKPAGLDAAVAIREMDNIQSDRFATLAQDYEQFHIDLAKITIAVARDAFGNGRKAYKVKAPGTKFIQSIDWRDVHLKDDEFTLKIYPISSLPKDPQGRLQTIVEHIQAGMLTPRQGQRLLDFPDLEQVEDLQNSQEDYMHMILEKIVEEGKYTPPDKNFDNLQLAGELVAEYYAQGRLNGLEPEKLDMLYRFQQQVQEYQKQAMQAAQALQAPQGVPQANPEAPPTNPMIQNVPGPQQAEQVPQLQ